MRGHRLRSPSTTTHHGRHSALSAARQLPRCPDGGTSRLNTAPRHSASGCDLLLRTLLIISIDKNQAPGQFGGSGIERLAVRLRRTVLSFKQHKGLKEHKKTYPRDWA